MISNHMGIIPLTDVIKVTKQVDIGAVDEWGVAIYEEESNEYKCHIAYNYKLEAVSIGGKTESLGNQVVYSAKIYFRGLVYLDDEDMVEFTDMTGKTVKKKILTVIPVRDFSGKVISTCLYI